MLLGPRGTHSPPATRKLVNLTISYKGKDEPRTRPIDLKVGEVIKSILPEEEKARSGQYVLSRRSKLLDPNDTLEASGVEEGDTLSLSLK